MPKSTKMMLGLMSLIALAAVGVAIYAGFSHPDQRADPSKLARSNSHHTGTGSVQLVEFGDFQCAPCGAAEPWLEQARRDFAGRLTFVYRNFPLTTIHPNALAAAEAAEDAGAQGKYWPMHDKLYAEQAAWSKLTDPRASFISYASAVGVPDVAKFTANLTPGAYVSVIRADITDGTSLGVDATPTFYLNGRQIAPAGYAELHRDIAKAVGR